MFSSLSRSVGYFGVNLFHDVIEVQYRLKNSGFPDLVVDGNCGQKTVAAIREFQRRFMSLPDGLVEVNGATIRRLQSTAISQGNARPDAPVPQASNAPVSGGVRRNVNELSVSPQAEALLKNYESLRLNIYSDKTKQEITQYEKGATIGYGHLICSQQEFEIYRNGISEMKANEMYHADASRFEKDVKKLITAEITQNEYDAVLILAFNIGSGDPEKNPDWHHLLFLK
ncbi:glycoside hydrolase family protein [Rahnella selenatireducens]|uniref:glycoside hydrolase family protein n=1 Tax=Rahnella selenatireducens TaxID=3389797 RepID=UPI00396869CB